MKFAEILTINKIQRTVDIHVPIKKNVAVGRMIVSLMKGSKRRLCQIRDIIGISARFDAISRIRKQVFHDMPFQKRVRRRKHTFHFIVHNAAIGQRSFRTVHFIMPSFLHQYLVIVQHIREKDGIQIYVHEIMEIFGIAAGHRIHSLIRECHGIEKCVE